MMGTRSFRFSLDLIGLFLGPLALLAWILLVPSGLPSQAHRLLGVLLLTIIWWITEPIPIAATGLLAVCLCVILGAVGMNAQGKPLPTRAVLEPFAEPSLFFLLGGLFLGRAMSRHGLDRRLALGILCMRWANRSPHTVLLAIGLAVATLSMWISNTAATAMIYPITLGIIAVLRPAEAAQPTDGNASYFAVLLLMTAFASGVGGVATPIGTGTNVTARGLLERPEYLGQRLDFLRWTVVGLPMMVLLLAGLFFWLRGQASRSHLDLPSLRTYLHTQRQQLGPWKTGEINTLIVFVIVVSLWVAPGLLDLLQVSRTAELLRARVPEEIAALLIPGLLFLLPVDWRKREFSLEPADMARVDWSTVLLFGSGMTLGTLMVRTGLADALGQLGFAWLNTTDLWLITAVAIASAIGLSQFTSNAAAVTALIPVIWSICRQAEVNPLPPLLGTTFGASFGSILPVSTPPNAIVYGSGLISVRRMIVAGLGLDMLSGVVIWTVLRVAWTLGWSPIVE